MDFADNLKFLRKYRKLTQAKLAENAHLSVSSIINYENRRRKDPSYSVMEALAKALDVTPETLSAQNLYICDNALFAEIPDKPGFLGGTFAFGEDGPPSDEAVDQYLNVTEWHDVTYSVDFAHNRLRFFLECLNETGLREAVKRVQELTEIHRYTLLKEGGTCLENELQTDLEHSRACDQMGDGKPSIALEGTPGQES